MAYLICLNISISSGWRNEIILILIAPYVVKYLAQNRRPKLFNLAVLTGFLYLLMGVVGLWRGAIKTGAVIRHITFKDIFNSFMVNIEVFFPYYHMISFIPKYFPFQLGKSYLNAIVQFIPRDLWPNKPYSPMKDFFVAIYGPAAKNGPAFPNIGEMYMDFGVFGVVILMGVFGLIAKKMYGLALSKDKLDLVAYSVFLLYLFFYLTRGHFPSICMDVIAMFSPIWIINYLTKDQKL